MAGIQGVQGVFGKSNVATYKIDPYEVIIEPGWNNRRDFTHVPELALSITELGVLQPLTVKILSDETIVLIDGECRLQATLLANKNGAEIKWIPAFIQNKNITQAESLFNALAMNQGTPLKPIELAGAYRRFIAWKWSQADIAKRMGKSQGHVSSTLALLAASPELAHAMQEGSIGATEATVIIKESRTADNPEIQQEKMVKKHVERLKIPSKRYGKLAEMFNEEVIRYFDNIETFKQARTGRVSILDTEDKKTVYGLGRISFLYEQYKATAEEIEELLK